MHEAPLSQLGLPPGCSLDTSSEDNGCLMAPDPAVLPLRWAAGQMDQQFKRESHQPQHDKMEAVSYATKSAFCRSAAGSTGESAPMPCNRPCLQFASRSLMGFEAFHPDKSLNILPVQLRASRVEDLHTAVRSVGSRTPFRCTSSVGEGPPACLHTGGRMPPTACTPPLLATS